VLSSTTRKSLVEAVKTPVDRIPTERIEAARNAARSALEPYVDAAGDQLSTGLDVARERVVPAITSAASTAADRVSPIVESARQRIRDDVAPAIVSAVDQARDATAPARAEAGARAGHALSALKGVAPLAPAPPKRRWPIALAGLAIGAAAGVVVSRLMKPPPPPPTPVQTGPRSVVNGTAAGDGSAPGARTVEPTDRGVS
jgi:hypothetical protein